MSNYINKHIIIGYGYCGYYLAQHLLQKNNQVVAISRNYDSRYKLDKLEHIALDIQNTLPVSTKNAILYYMIPPPSDGITDKILAEFLEKIHPKQAKKIVYFGSSSVYGNKMGQWVNEKSSCDIKTLRQKRRLDAEMQLAKFCSNHNINCTILRIAGIYGKNRIPTNLQQPIIEPTKAPLSNLIYVKDLASIASQLGSIDNCSKDLTTPTFRGLSAESIDPADKPWGVGYEVNCQQALVTNNATGIYNISDGQPRPMGSLQEAVAKYMGVNCQYQAFEEIWISASPIKREFLSASKQLDTQKLKDTLGDKLKITPLKDAIAEIFT